MRAFIRVCSLVSAWCVVVPVAVSSFCTSGAFSHLGGEFMSLGLFLVIAFVLVMIVVTCSNGIRRVVLWKIC